MDWSAHKEQLIHEDLFENEYTMSPSAHGELLEILRPQLQRKEYNSRSTKPIEVEHMVAASLRYLQGGRIKDARHIIKTSQTAAYVAVDDFIYAVNNAPELDIKLPSNAEEWKAVNHGFRAKSFNNTMSGAQLLMLGFSPATDQRTKKPVT